MYRGTLALNEINMLTTPSGSDNLANGLIRLTEKRGSATCPISRTIAVPWGMSKKAKTIAHAAAIPQTAIQTV
jgi:hypothetical protein